jgi:hypothetical protein
MICHRHATTALIALFFGWSAAVYAENTWIQVKGGDWVPEAQTLTELKAGVAPYAQGQAQAQGRKLRNWSNYTFQYQGIEGKGRKFILVNALCHKDAGWNLEQRMIMVLDGGSCFFRLKFDPERRQYFDLTINGEA